MHFELSIPLIWLFLLGTLSLRKAKQIFSNIDTAHLIISLLLPSYISLSLLWTQNKLRGFLTSGIVWLIFLFVWRIISETKTHKFNYLKIIDIYLKSAVVFAAIGVLQGFLDIFGAPSKFTLLCTGCSYKSFGFPHPNGFAIEPQFMGNLLIIPCILSIFILYKTIKENKSKTIKRKSFLLCLFLNMSLYVIFSRGACFALGLVATIFSIKCFINGNRKATVCVLGCGILAILSGLTLQGIWAQLSPTSENFYDGVARSIHQMSLGKIDIRRNNITILEPHDKSFDSGSIEIFTCRR